MAGIIPGYSHDIFIIRWAREVALPEIEQLIGENDAWRNLVAPYRLAEQAEAILGEDSTLVALISQCSRRIDILTEPPGASVYMKEYVHPDTEWSFLGITPLDSIRVPIGIFRWKLEKKGYETAFGFRTAFFEADYRSQPPVSNATFQFYREQFAYDQRELNSTVEFHEESPGGWIHELVSFDAAYGKERVLAHLFLPLPTSTQQPYQTVIYFPGDASTWMPSSEGLESYYEFTMFLSFLVRNGRAVLFPVYKVTFERGGPEYIALLQVLENTYTYAYTELMTQEVKDLRRSIDYLQTRPEIDDQNIAFYGMCWGAYMGSIIPAVEDRLVANVLVAGGLLDAGRPEASNINYVSRVRTPTLMLNGKYDVIFPPETSSRPMFDLLGTPDEKKHIIFYETDHIPPRTEYIKETLAWLDRYLGPVR